MMALVMLQLVFTTDSAVQTSTVNLPVHQQHMTVHSPSL